MQLLAAAVAAAMQANAYPETQLTLSKVRRGQADDLSKRPGLMQAY